MRYKISEYAKKHGVNYKTAWEWVKAGKVKYQRTPGGRIWIVEGEE